MDQQVALEEEECQGEHDRWSQWRITSDAAQAALPLLERRMAVATSMLQGISAPISAENGKTDALQRGHASVAALRKLLSLGMSAAPCEAIALDTVTQHVAAAEVAAARAVGRSERAAKAREVEISRLQICQAHYNEVNLINVSIL